MLDDVAVDNFHDYSQSRACPTNRASSGSAQADGEWSASTVEPSALAGRSTALRTADRHAGAGAPFVPHVPGPVGLPTVAPG